MSIMSLPIFAAIPIKAFGAATRSSSHYVLTSLPSRGYISLQCIFGEAMTTVYEWFRYNSTASQSRSLVCGIGIVTSFFPV